MSPTTSQRLKKMSYVSYYFCTLKKGGLGLSIWLFRALYVTHSKLLMLKREKKSTSYTSVRVPLKIHLHVLDHCRGDIKQKPTNMLASTTKIIFVNRLFSYFDA